MTNSKAPRVCNSEYASLAETRALVKASAASRKQLLSAANMLTCAQAAMNMGCLTEQMRSWAEKGKVVALWDTKRRAFRLPDWQFQPAIWVAIPSIAEALGGDGWAVFNFLESPCGALNGRTPRQALEAGETSRVIELAAAE